MLQGEFGYILDRMDRSIFGTDQKWPCLTKCTHSWLVGRRFEDSLVDLLFTHTASRDCNPGLEFSIPRFGIVEFPIPGSCWDWRSIGLLKLPHGLRYSGHYLWTVSVYDRAMDLVLMYCKPYSNKYTRAADFNPLNPKFPCVSAQ